MDRPLEQQEKELIRSTMQMQDHTLRYQVREMHRLYDVQKKLMKEMDKETTELPTVPDLGNSQSSGDSGFQIDHDPSLKEKNGNCSSDIPLKLTNYFNLESHAAKDNNSHLNVMDNQHVSTPVGFSHLSINNGDDEGGELDLTLSIGCGGNSNGKGKST